MNAQREEIGSVSTIDGVEYALTGSLEIRPITETASDREEHARKSSTSSPLPSALPESAAASPSEHEPAVYLSENWVRRHLEDFERRQRLGLPLPSPSELAEPL